MDYNDRNLMFPAFNHVATPRVTKHWTTMNGELIICVASKIGN